MAERISKRVREEAALLCSIAASTDILVTQAAGFIGASDDAVALAYDAWSRSFWNTDHLRGLDWCEDWAEAESLLRCGWLPGDEL